MLMRGLGVFGMERNLICNGSAGAGLGDDTWIVNSQSELDAKAQGCTALL
jgi:hypothetical protein